MIANNAYKPAVSGRVNGSQYIAYNIVLIRNLATDEDEFPIVLERKIPKNCSGRPTRENISYTYNRRTRGYEGKTDQCNI